MYTSRISIDHRRASQDLNVRLKYIVPCQKHLSIRSDKTRLKCTIVIAQIYLMTHYAYVIQ